MNLRRYNPVFFAFAFMIASAAYQLFTIPLEFPLITFVAITTTFTGLWLASKLWKKVYRSKNELVTDGAFKHVRHPQYSIFLLISLLWVFVWPSLLTAFAWLLLAGIYYKLALGEERYLRQKFGKSYEKYQEKVPMMVPFLYRKEE